MDCFMPVTELLRTQFEALANEKNVNMTSWSTKLYRLKSFSGQGCE